MLRADIAANYEKKESDVNDMITILSCIDRIENEEIKKDIINVVAINYIDCMYNNSIDYNNDDRLRKIDIFDLANMALRELPVLQWTLKELSFVYGLDPKDVDTDALIRYLNGYARYDITVMAIMREIVRRKEKHG